MCNKVTYNGINESETKGYTVIMDTTLIQVKLYKVVYFHVKRKHIPILNLIPNKQVA